MSLSTVCWLVGLSGSGKSTISRLVESTLKLSGIKIEVLDGDDIRKRLSPDLGYEYNDRITQVKRTVFLAEILARHGILVLAPLITPYTEMREYCRKQLVSYVEVYVKCPIDICMERDVKGLYKKAIEGRIPLFTGLTDRFDEPISPDLIVETDKESPEESAAKVVDLLRSLPLMSSLGENGGD
ncbi:adenylyl-sulfate kinase [Cohnella herbarum]|uniref:Adenylyl-sulfate kinase n=1 Tax=Cohnella herbarum TaxID=2728023 RepID=A0A7Z2ZMM0_9BACL|nr:adenylyl-sulfate kinase [Cohnella herbarum]QJD85129.1 adenylyl-sulfate kinase [Cohnella herbarum]